MVDPMLERLLRHQVMIQRLSSGQIKRAMPVLRQLAKDLRARVVVEDVVRMEAIRADVDLLIRTAVADMQGSLELGAFAAQEADFTQKLLGSSVSVDLAGGVSADAVAAITTRRKLTLVAGDKIKQLTIPEMFDEFGGAVGREAMRTVQAGLIEGRTQVEMADDVSSMVTTRSRRQAEAVIRTATNGVGSAARREVYSANSDVLDGEVWTSTLDGKTSAVCRSRDGNRYDVGEGPYPPAHYNCRSVRRPSVKPEYRVGRVGERASMDGPVDSRTTYGGFLKRQSKEFQDDVLGPRRGGLFRSGKVKIDQFVDDMGRSLSLDELVARYDITMV